MIFKGLRTYLRHSARNTFKCLAKDTAPLYFLTNKINFLKSTQQSINNREDNKKNVESARSEKKDYSNKSGKGKQDKKQFPLRSLAQMIKQYRIRMEKTEDPVGELTYHLKSIADHYKRFNHALFVEQKGQFESILQTILTTDCSKISLNQYFYLLDFLRVCTYIQSITRSLLSKVQQKIFKLFSIFQKQIDNLSIQQLSTLYCKVTPVYHPQTFKISGLLHDKIASELEEDKTLSISFLQIFIIMKSMSKKQFLSFPDKKILELLLQFISTRRMDKPLTIQLAVVLKDIQVQINISDNKICQISRKIQRTALKYIEKGVDESQIQYLLFSKKSQSQFFQNILLIIARNTLAELNLPENSTSIMKFKRLPHLVKKISKKNEFKLAERQLIVKFCVNYLKQKQDKKQTQQFSFEILDLIRTDFFGEDLSLLDSLFEQNLLNFIWSFPYQYSKRNIPFPLKIMENKIGENTSKLRMQANNLKTFVALAVQARLHPQSEILQKYYNQAITEVKDYFWEQNQFSSLIKFSIYDHSLITKFHQQYHQHFLNKLIPTAEQVKKQKLIKKGNKSSLLKFWEYLLIQNEVSNDLVSSIPQYSIFLMALREKSIKNQDLSPKIVLLQAINCKLISGKIKFADQDSSQIIEMLTAYSNHQDYENQYVNQLYWSCVNHLIDQYGFLRKTSLPYVQFLISKLLHVENIKIKHSIYYKRFLMELIKAVGLLTISVSHEYFKTSIIRQGLHNNLISDLNLPQLQLSYFNDQEKDMFQAISGKFKRDNYSQENLISFFKLPKLPQDAVEDMERIFEVLEQSSIEYLSKYLTHYSFEKSKLGDKISKKTCDLFIKKLSVKQIDIMSLLRNLAHLSNSDSKLFENVLKQICNKLIISPSSIYLADHLQILRALHEFHIEHKQYEIALWDYTKKCPYRSSAYLSILLQLSKNTQEIQIKAEDFEHIDKFVIPHPQYLFKLFVYHEEIFPNIAQKVRKTASYITSPIQKSLFVSYLESKYEIVIAKSKTSSSVLYRASPKAYKLLKAIQQQGISVKMEEKHGEFIHQIGDNIIVVYLRKTSGKEYKIINKMLQHLYPKQEIIEISIEEASKENEFLLNQLHILHGQVFTSKLIEKLENEDQLIQ